MQTFKLIFWTLGFGMLVWAIRSVEFGSVLALVARMQWGLLAVLSVYVLVNLLDAESWRLALKPVEAEPIGLWTMWKFRQIGEAFNMATPLGSVGGEPLKAQLLKENFGLSLKQGLASIVVARTTNLLGLILFLIIGMILLWPSAAIAPSFKVTGLAGLTVLCILILLFLYFQMHGGLKSVSRWVVKLPYGNAIEHQLEHLEILSHQMAEYYRENPVRCLGSVWYAFAGWMLGIGEIYLTMLFLGKPLGFVDLWIIEALAQLIKAAIFFIPMSLGALEAGMMAIFASMGLGPDLGLAATLVRRIKELTWIALGLAMSGHMALNPFKVKSE